MTPYELHLAIRYLRFRRGKTFLSLITIISVAGVTVGTGAIVVALSLMNGFVQDFRDRILSGSAHLQVLHAFDEFSADIPAVGDVVASNDEVVRVAPVVFSHSMIVADTGVQSYAQVYGIEPRVHPDVLGADAETRVALASLEAETRTGRDPVVLGRTLARRLGALEGDLVRIIVPRLTLTPFAAMPRSRTFEVVGTYASDNLEQDAQRVYVPLSAAQRMLGVDGRYSHLEVRLEDASRMTEVRDDVRAAVGPEWLVVDLIEQNRMFIKALNEEKIYLLFAIWLIVVVAALNIVSTLVLMVSDKVKDIGTLVAMGARPFGIASTFLLQGVIIGFVGTICGLALGSGLAWWLDRYEVFQLDPEVYYVTHVRFILQSSDLLRAAALSMGTSLVATIYPAWRAARLDPVEALRYE